MKRIGNELEALRSLVTTEAPNSQRTGDMTVSQSLKKTDSFPPQL